jgi:hypothetical protein
LALFSFSKRGTIKTLVATGRDSRREDTMSRFKFGARFCVALATLWIFQAAQTPCRIRLAVVTYTPNYSLFHTSTRQSINNMSSQSKSLMVCQFLLWFFNFTSSIPRPARTGTTPTIPPKEPQPTVSAQPSTRCAIAGPQTQVCVSATPACRVI